MQIFAETNGISETIPVGSELNYALIASGDLDVFPLLVGSSEWDTAPGQAILGAVGGQVLNWHTDQTLTHGKSLRRNPRLLSIGSRYTYSDFNLKDYPEVIL